MDEYWPDYLSKSQMVEGTVSKRMGNVSTAHFRIEAEINGNEKTFSLHTFDGTSFNMNINDVIDVIFTAYKEAARHEK